MNRAVDILWTILILGALFIGVKISRADQIVPTYSFEKHFLQRGVGGSDRRWGLEYIKEFDSPHILKAGLGAYLVSAPERRDSGYGYLAYGYRVELPWGPFVEASFGPGFITHTDSRLGSRFQLFHGLVLGIMRDGYGFGISGLHISNAGLIRPNRGRDFLGFNFLIRI